MKAALWVISLLAVGVQAFFMPRCIVGRSVCGRQGAYRDSKGNLPAALPSSAIFSLKVGSNGGLARPAASNNSSQPPVLQELALAKAKGDMDGVVHALHMHLKALPDGRPQPLSKDMLGIVEEVVDRIPAGKLARWMWCLGKMGFKAGIPRHRAVLLKSVDKLLGKNYVLVQDMSMLLTALSRTGIVLSDLQDNQRAALMRNVEQVAMHLLPNNLSSILTALFQLGASWTTLSVTTQDALWRRFEEIAETKTMEDRNAAEAVKAFADLQLHVGNMSETQLLAFLQVAERGIHADNSTHGFDRLCQHASMTLLGLGKLGFQYASFPPALLKWIESSLVQLSPHFNDEAVANVINWFGKVNWHWSAAIPALQTALQDAALKASRSLSSRGLFLVLQGLTRMGVKWTELQLDLVWALTDQLDKTLTSPHFYNQHDAVQHMATIVNLLGRLDADYSSFSPALQQCIQDTFLNLHKLLTSNALGMYLHGLGKMGAEWNSFSKEFQDTVFATFARTCNELDAQALAVVMHGLGSMGTKFQQLPPSFIANVEKSLLLLIDGNCLDGQDGVMVLSGLANMGAVWAQLPRQTLEHMIGNIAPKVDQQNMAGCIYNLAVLGASWDGLPLTTISALCNAFEISAPRMDTQSIANSMFGLAMLSFDISSAIEAQDKRELLLSASRAALRKFRQIDKSSGSTEKCWSQFSTFFEVLRTLPGGKQLIAEELGNRPSFASHRRNQEPTSLHRDLSGALQNMLGGKFHVANKVDRLQAGTLEADMVVSHKNGTLIAFVEINGKMDHVMVNDTLALRRRQLLKQHLYAQHYPDAPLFRVVVDSQNGIDVSKEAERLMKLIKAKVASRQGSHADHPLVTDRQKVEQAIAGEAEQKEKEVDGEQPRISTKKSIFSHKLKRAIKSIVQATTNEEHSML